MRKNTSGVPLKYSAILMLSMLMACNGQKNNNNDRKVILGSNKLLKQSLSIKEQFLKKDRETPIKMGHGFDSRTGMSLGASCLANYGDPYNLDISNQSANIHFTSSSNSAVISNLLSTGISGKANFGLYSASLSAQFARNSLNTRQDLHFNYWQSVAADVLYKVPTLGNNALSTDARYILEHGGGMDMFTSVCGDSFIHSAQLGAVLFIDVAVHFANAEAKTAFETKIAGKAVGLGSIEATFKNIDQTITKNASVEVEAMQLGGDVTKFAEIFGSKDSQTQNYHLTSCAAQDLTSCYRMINDAIDYARNTLDKTVDFKKLETLYTFGYSEKTYKSLGIQAFLPELSEAEQKAKDYIADTITIDRRMLEYLHSYQKQSVMALVGIEVKNYLARAIEKYDIMLKEYDNYQIIDACYGDTNNIEKRCVFAAEHIKEMREKYKEYINFANNLSSTIIAKTEEVIGQYHTTIYATMIPLGANECNDKGECMGIYAMYKPGANGLIEYAKANCYIDTTIDNKFAKIRSEARNKLYFCEETNDNFHLLSIYVRRIPGLTFNYGVYGYFVTTAPFTTREDDDAYGVHGNTDLFYSLAPEFTYNPI
jgi:hypothetical protein